jgi:hypothetical protein
MRSVLKIKLSDVFRATLPADCGNEGYIGVAPDWDAYHVVVPVDRQMARSVKARIEPTDGTPFGGYTGWSYYLCPPFEAPLDGGSPDRATRLTAARDNAELIRKVALGLGIGLEIVEDMGAAPT